MGSLSGRLPLLGLLLSLSYSLVTLVSPLGCSQVTLFALLGSGRHTSYIVSISCAGYSDFSATRVVTPVFFLVYFWVQLLLCSGWVTPFLPQPQPR